MDRLICGDVGFGKTEAAQCALFYVVSSGKQEMVLPPTMVLAKQLCGVISERFSKYLNIRFGFMSRVQTASESSDSIILDDNSASIVKVVHNNIRCGYDSDASIIFSLIKTTIGYQDEDDGGDEMSKWHVYVIGHNLGGALATLLTLELSSNQLAKSIVSTDNGNSRIDISKPNRCNHRRREFHD